MSETITFFTKFLSSFKYLLLTTVLALLALLIAQDLFNFTFTHVSLLKNNLPIFLGTAAVSMAVSQRLSKTK